MKLILSSIVVLLSLNSLAQTASELTREEKLAVFKEIGHFIPSGEFRGHILGVSKNPLNVHRCVGGVFSISPESLNSSLRENKAFPLEAFMDSYHPNPVGITLMTIDDKITHASLSTTKVSITAQDRKDGSTETLEVEKVKHNHAIVTVTYSLPDGRVFKNGCNLDLDKKFQGNN
jgi:hypothetical protein